MKKLAELSEKESSFLKTSRKQGKGRVGRVVTFAGYFTTSLMEQSNSNQKWKKELVLDEEEKYQLTGTALWPLPYEYTTKS